MIAKPKKEQEMPVKLILRKQEYEVKAGITLRNALLEHGIQPEAVLAVHAGALITEDEVLREGETIKLVSVISGGAV